MTNSLWINVTTTDAVNYWKQIPRLKLYHIKQIIFCNSIFYIWISLASSEKLKNLHVIAVKVCSLLTANNSFS